MYSNKKINAVLSDLEPKNVFYFFEEICRIPHGSGNTKAISDYLRDFAVERSLEYYQDDLNNVIIYKNMDCDDEGIIDNKSYFNDEPIILQGHMDMVCEKSPESSKNMEIDALDLVVDGDFISADGTSLGADNGIAIAMMLAILDDDELDLPSIEAVFTADEEIGLIGAEGLDLSNLSGRALINLDSELEGYLVVSCAGGNRLDMRIPLDYYDLDDGLIGDDYRLIEVFVDGLRGGHSGIEINKGLANANKIIAEMLAILNDKVDIKLINIEGGNADNAIPTEAKCAFLAKVDEVKDIVEEYGLRVNREVFDLEEDFSLEFRASGISKWDVLSSGVLSDETRDNVIGFLNAVPNGVCKMSDDISGLVETSLNLGVMELDYDFNATISVRSAFDSERDKLNDDIVAIAEEFNGIVDVRGDYPSWEYDEDSKLRDLICRVYEEEYGKPMVVEIIHAGLECGLFVNKIDGLDAVSMGPTLRDVHSFNERMSISSVYRTYNLLIKILKEFKYNK